MGVPVNLADPNQQVPQEINSTQVINKGLMILTVIITIFSFFIILFSSAISQYYKEKYTTNHPETPTYKSIDIVNN